MRLFLPRNKEGIAKKTADMKPWFYQEIHEKNEAEKCCHDGKNDKKECSHGEREREDDLVETREEGALSVRKQTKMVGERKQHQQQTKKRENGFSLCFFFIAPLNTEQHPQRRPIRSQVSEPASQWGAWT